MWLWTRELTPVGSVDCWWVYRNRCLWNRRLKLTRARETTLWFWPVSVRNTLSNPSTHPSTHANIRLLSLPKFLTEIKFLGKCVFSLLRREKLMSSKSTHTTPYSIYTALQSWVPPVFCLILGHTRSQKKMARSQNKGDKFWVQN